MLVSTDVSFRSALGVWWQIGLQSFGGPAGQIALMHRIIVEERHWLDESRFLHALNYCMLLPGPEAQQLATYIGWLLHGVRGGLVAGTLFILPGALAMLALSWFYVLAGASPLMEGLFFGLKAAVLAIVAQALVRIASRTLHGIRARLLAGAGFVALFAFGLPFPLVVLAAGLIGWASAIATDGRSGNAISLDANAPPQPTPAPVPAGTGRAAAICAALWLTTLALTHFLPDTGQVYREIAAFFSKLAVVTFGGAYAVLGYVAQQGVDHYGWLAPGEMLDGLGLAETTPGPLILVTQFVGFLAAFRAAAPEYALLAGSAGALLTTWVTFLPCFLWIFLGAPYVERLRRQAALAAALAAITAVVVGVIANLAVWFATHFLFAEHIRITGWGLELVVPVASSIDLPALILAGVAAGLVFGARLGVLAVLVITGVLGIAWRLVGTSL
jgi:chromate transporter